MDSRALRLGAIREPRESYNCVKRWVRVFGILGESLKPRCVRGNWRALVRAARTRAGSPDYGWAEGSKGSLGIEVERLIQPQEYDCCRL